MQPRKKKIIYISSGGGHQKQLRGYLSVSSIKPDVVICATSLYDSLDIDGTVYIPDCNLKTPIKLITTTYNLALIFRKTPPSLILTTGAAPGGIGIMLAKLFFGAKTIWIDSMANTQKPSLTGKLVRPFCDHWISQWADVANAFGGIYIGKIYNIFNSRDSA